MAKFPATTTRGSGPGSDARRATTSFSVTVFTDQTADSAGVPEPMASRTTAQANSRRRKPMYRSGSVNTDRTVVLS